MENPGVQDTLLEMVDRLKKNKYIRWAFPHFLFMPRSRSASVDFWFSAFKESELREEEKSFYEKLGAFLINQPKYIQVGALLQIQLDAPIFIHFIFGRTCNLMFHQMISGMLWNKALFPSWLVLMKTRSMSYQISKLVFE